MEISESRLTEEVWAKWFTPFLAIQRLITAGLEDREHAVNWLIARLQSGELRGAGIWWVFDDELEPGEQYIRIWKSEVWKNIEQVGWKHDFWISGDYHNAHNKKITESILPVWCSFYEVRFDRLIIDGFCNIVAKSDGIAIVQELPASKGTEGRRGAKRKDWWDHLWIEMIRKITAKTLNPKNQASLQAILEDYVRDELSIEVGDSTLKPMAANLFKYLQELSGEIGENSKF